MNKKDYEKLNVAEEMYLLLCKWRDWFEHSSGLELSKDSQYLKIVDATEKWAKLNTDRRLFDKKLDEVLHKLELDAIYQAGLCHINGGFATSEIIDEDDSREIPCFNIELKYGIQNESENRVTTAHLKIRKDNYEILEEY